jgi:hypothetical protein
LSSLVLQLVVVSLVKPAECLGLGYPV